jgi:FlaG/FlaF family flagellin (archaellin)
MKNILKNRKALSTVVTTLIILVVSVLLAGVVSYFAINVTSTRVQEESLQLASQHIWVDSTGAAQGAIMITNTGGRDVVINKLAVRGQASAWGDVFYLIAATDDSRLTGDLLHLPVANLTTGGEVTGFAATLEAASMNIVLPSGNTIVIYVADPDSITINDIGITVAFTVFTSQAMYYKETNVNAAI